MLGHRAGVNKTADRILVQATRLFAERGFDGTSVRAICEAADANVNGVSYHFGGKKALYQAVINRWGDERLASAQRALGAPPTDAEDFETRLLVFADETLAAHLAAPEPLIILFAESSQKFRNCEPAAVERLSNQSSALLAFLKAAQEGDLLREGVNINLVTGGLFERLYSQVLHADSIELFHGTSIKDPVYRRQWCRQIIDLLLYGVARSPKESS